MKKLNKTASMQLSINAIVILVMAMAVLGIGLGLIRGVLAPAQGNLEDALGKVDLSEIATSSQPIANLPSKLNMKFGSDNQIAISFYNTGYACSEAEFDFTCGEIDILKVQSLPMKVTQGSAETLIAVFNPTDASLTGKKPCQVSVTCDNVLASSKAIFISFNG